MTAWLIEFAPLIVAAVVGAGGLPMIVGQTKEAFSLQDQQALLLSWATAIVAGLVVSFADGLLTEGAFSAENFVESVLTVWAASQVQYKRLQWGNE